MKTERIGAKPPETRECPGLVSCHRKTGEKHGAEFSSELSGRKQLCQHLDSRLLD